VVGRLDSQQTEPLRFRGPAGLAELRRLWDEDLVTAATRPAGDIHLRPLLETAVDFRRLRPGDARLVGWTDQAVPGLTIHPRASQHTMRTVLVANLRYGPLPPPRGDAESARQTGFTGGKYPELRALQRETDQLREDPFQPTDDNSGAARFPARPQAGGPPGSSASGRQ
jgi:hypothetical protein